MDIDPDVKHTAEEHTERHHSSNPSLNARAVLLDGKAILGRRQKISTFANDFESSTSEDFYAPVASYEGAHRYDPKFAWEPSEERKLVRKVCCCAERSYLVQHLIALLA